MQKGDVAMKDLWASGITETRDLCVQQKNAQGEWVATIMPPLNCSFYGQIRSFYRSCKRLHPDQEFRIAFRKVETRTYDWEGLKNGQD